MELILVGHTFFTLAMFGLMWSVQIVVYPQLRNIGPTAFVEYVTHHSGRMVVALAPLAPLEIVFAAWLWLDRPAAVSNIEVFVSGALLAAGWIWTAVWFAPLHTKLQAGHDLTKINSLISTNWIRTIIWTLRAGFALWFLASALEA